MPHGIVCKKKAKILSFLVFLVGLAIISYTKTWWPGVLLAVGIPLALKQYLQGRRYDFGITLFVFLGGFVTVAFDIQWEVILPVLFIIGGIYILCRDFLEGPLSSEVEKEEDINEEIEEESHKK